MSPLRFNNVASSKKLSVKSVLILVVVVVVVVAVVVLLFLSSLLLLLLLFWWDFLHGFFRSESKRDAPLTADPFNISFQSTGRIVGPMLRERV